MGHVIVMFYKTVPVSDRIARLDELGNRIVSDVERAGLYLVEVPAGTEDEWAARYAQLEGVRAAEKEKFLDLA